MSSAAYCAICSANAFRWSSEELYAGISFAAAVLYIALQHYVSSHDVVVLATLLFGFTARMLALRWKLGLPVFHYTHDAH